MPELTLVPGLTQVSTLAVTEDLTVPRVSPHLVAFADMPPVFATAYMVGFIEATCIEALAPHLADGEHSVGTHVNVSHVAATPIGDEVTASVILIGVEGRRITFEVEARDRSGVIGTGTHQRAIINLQGFLERNAAKAGSYQPASNREAIDV